MAPRPAQLQFSPQFRHQLKKLSRKNQKLTKRIYIILGQLAFNPQLASLKMHKLTSMKEKFAISADYGTRIVFSWKDARTIILISVGSHDQVYR